MNSIITPPAVFFSTAWRHFPFFYFELPATGVSEHLKIEKPINMAFSNKAARS
jgi:hypothetical protein